ncbi:MAG: hypothetical protein WB508_06355 [Aeromicrobium sp.]|uniref:hypothetical protein n=1 Tax=Aeromicrobium sp. TaxID=1871063 RepID=UPI003C5C3929
MVSRLCSAVIVAVAALLLVACTGDPEPVPSPSTSTSTDPTASPTPGTLVGRDSFALTLPEGWTERPDASGALLLGTSDQMVDGYPMNVHVVADTTLTEFTPAQMEDARESALSEADATSIKSLGEFEVDGEQGVRLSYRQDVRGIDVLTVEVTAAHGDSGYIVAFSFAPTVDKAVREDVVTSVMDSWTWAQ